MFPPMAFGYILAMLGLFGVPSIIMLMGQNGVVTFPGFAVKGPTDYMNMSGLLYNITGPLGCVNTTITALAGAYLHETSYNITGPMGRVSTTITAFEDPCLQNADIGVVLARLVGIHISSCEVLTACP